MVRPLGQGRCRSHLGDGSVVGEMLEFVGDLVEDQGEGILTVANWDVCPGPDAMYDAVGVGELARSACKRPRRGCGWGVVIGWVRVLVVIGFVCPDAISGVVVCWCGGGGVVSGECCCSK